ncbi:serine/threonine protein kinase [Streptomyces somaliensis]|uniref:serine/threonine-protein kinase n=1 Tax=Streptomyces somaliensis TaxID=78355 RepID=UPI0020CD6915|nr:serine/threonine-protein kinase [Streptomyces somaliensis]MCP9946859.1 serine/threonine protein kinase [Streptomyces somaliensis]MCP9963498.1 serine/threonine protein kinase [Streptomyces somaliensis]
MTIHGGQHEPTSYPLRPPLPPPRRVAPAEADAPPAVPQGPAEPGPAAAPGPESGAGRLIGGRYRLLERLGSGGMGTVWRARDEVVDRDVAVKEPSLPDTLGDPERRTAHQRMQREARAAARIDHPSVVCVHDVVTEGDSPWIVMELVRGKSLADLLDEGTLPPPEAARIGLAVLGALTAAHEAGVLHRDVKPGNVMVGRHGRVVLTDFGIAQVEGEQKLTETGGFIGSPEYIAPERVLGRRPGPESDLWSLGVMLYQAVEGVSPFRRQTTPSTLQAILLAELPPPQHAGELHEVLRGLLRKEPESRLSAEQALGMLRSAAAERRPAEAAGPAGVPFAGARGAGTGARRRRRVLAAAVGAVAALALVAGLVLRSAGEGLPEGWKRYDEYRMQLSVAAPEDWTITTEDDPDGSGGPYVGTRYTSPSGDRSILVDELKGVTETAVATAERWKREYTEETPPEGGQPAVSHVRAVTHQGRDAALFASTYSSDAEGAPRRVTRTLIVVSSRQERLTLTVIVPAGKGAEKTAEDLLGKARPAFEIRDL